MNIYKRHHGVPFVLLKTVTYINGKTGAISREINIILYYVILLGTCNYRKISTGNIFF